VARQGRRLRHSRPRRRLCRAHQRQLQRHHGSAVARNGATAQWMRHQGAQPVMGHGVYKHHPKIHRQL